MIVLDSHLLLGVAAILVGISKLVCQCGESGSDGSQPLAERSRSMPQRAHSRAASKQRTACTWQVVRIGPGSAGGRTIVSFEPNNTTRLNPSPDTVLVVEDDRLVAMTVQLQLEELDVPNIHVAHTIKEAVNLLDRVRFDLAILDYNLGAETSLAIAERLAEQGVRIVFASGQPINLPGPLSNAVVIMKPYAFEQLRTVVEG